MAPPPWRGFFLTAVPNWTGAKAAPRIFISVVAGLWLIGRIALWYSADLPAPIVAVADLAFVPILAAKILTQLLKRPKAAEHDVSWPAQPDLDIANLIVHLEWMGITSDTAYQGLRAGLYTLCAMIAVLGGRIVPAFTRNAMTRTGRETDLPQSYRPLELPGIAFTIALPVTMLINAPAPLFGGVAIIAGAANIARVAGWRPGFTLNQPILWALHLSFALIGAGLIATGLAALNIGAEIAALHLLAIGGVGGMTLAVMSRATLGHSGRPLVAPGAIVASYILIPIAALLRWVAPILPDTAYTPTLIIAGLIWTLAFTLYAAALWPAFWGEKTRKGANA